MLNPVLFVGALSARFGDMAANLHDSQRRFRLLDLLEHRCVQRLIQICLAWADVAADGEPQ